MVNFTQSKVSQSKSSSYDLGLRSYMLKVFNYMCLALCITGATSYMTISTPLIHAFFNHGQGGIGMSGLGWAATFAPLVFVMFFSSKIHTMHPGKAKFMLMAFGALMGLSLAPIFLLYTGASIVRMFFITASVFASMSLYGYTTKRDLTAFGSFLMMGLIGIIIASVVNMFMKSPAIYFVTSVIGVLIFTGLTAYDVQKIVRTYSAVPSSRRENAAVLGALSLYLDFINLFLMLLRLFGNRR